MHLGPLRRCWKEPATPRVLGAWKVVETETPCLNSRADQEKHQSGKKACVKGEQGRLGEAGLAGVGSPAGPPCEMISEAQGLGCDSARPGSHARCTTDFISKVRQTAVGYPLLQGVVTS